jgi:hypothetical protein
MITTMQASLIPSERIERSILLIRGHKVMLDSDLAELYGVPTMVLNQAVKRKQDRFPEDFMFQLNKEELENLRSQIVTSNFDLKIKNLISQNVISSWGGHRKLPYVFTEHGVAMLSGVLKSPRAVQVNLAIIRAFIQMRQLIASQSGLMKKILEIEKKYDKQFMIVFEAIKKLMEPLKENKKSLYGGSNKDIGFIGLKG